MDLEFLGRVGMLVGLVVGSLAAGVGYFWLAARGIVWLDRLPADAEADPPVLPPNWLDPEIRRN